MDSLPELASIVTVQWTAVFDTDALASFVKPPLCISMASAGQSNR